MEGHNCFCFSYFDELASVLLLTIFNDVNNILKLYHFLNNLSNEHIFYLSILASTIDISTDKEVACVQCQDLQ